MTNPDDDRTKTKQEWSIALAHRQRQLMNTCKERDEALDQVKALQDEVNRLEAELQKERHKRSCTSSEPAHMAKGGLPGMPDIIFASEEDAQVLIGLGKQRDQARARVAELEGAVPAAPEDDTEDGGPYSVICDRIVGNQIRSDEGVFTLNTASFSAVGFAPEEAKKFCDRLNRERDRRIDVERERDALRAHFDKIKELARKGLLSTGPAQILQSGLQVTPVSDGPERDTAYFQNRLDGIQAYCSAAYQAASDLRDTIEQGGAK